MKPIIITSLILIFAVNIVFADGENTNAEEVLINKARMKAESSNECDWKALADCAKSLLDQRINCVDALTWLEKSISVEENYYNLTLLGDYYRINREFTKANEHYIMAILSAQKERRMDVIPAIQWKVLVTLGTKNYYDFQDKQEKPENN